MHVLMRRRSLLTTLLLAGCAGAPPASPPVRFIAWQDDAGVYRLGAGDDLEVVLPLHPEFSQRVLVGPDGHFTLPLVGDVRAGGRTIADLTEELNHRFSTDLVNPRVQIAIRAYASQRVFVGGEVYNPGMYTLPGRVGVLEAVLMAGGFRSTAARHQVALIRRGKGGPMLRRIDVGALLAAGTDDVPLERLDIVFVPKTTIAEVDEFVVQFVRGVLPFDSTFNYTIGRTSY